MAAEQVYAWLRAGKTIRVEWDAGGDETLVDVYVDEDRRPWNDGPITWLADIIADALELPNAGEWFVKGGGVVRLNGEKLEIEHESVSNGMAWDPETDEEYWVEDETIAGTDVIHEP